MSQLNKNGLYLVLSALFIQGANNVAMPQIIVFIMMVGGGVMFLWSNKEI